MKNVNTTGLKFWFCYSLLLFFITQPLRAEILPSGWLEADEPPVSVTELKYEKLMKAYVNQIKMAFAATEDQQSLAILAAYLPEFSRKTDLIIKELQGQFKQLSQPEKEFLLHRLKGHSHTEELIALYFDERVTSRTAANQKLKAILEQLHAKSLEVQQTGQKFIAAD